MSLKNNPLPSLITLLILLAANPVWATRQPHTKFHSNAVDSPDKKDNGEKILCMNATSSNSQFISQNPNQSSFHNQSFSDSITNIKNYSGGSRLSRNTGNILTSPFHKQGWGGENCGKKQVSLAKKYPAQYSAPSYPHPNSKIWEIRATEFTLSQNNENQKNFIFYRYRIDDSSLGRYSIVSAPEIEIPIEFTDPRQISAQLLAKTALNYAKIGQTDVAEEIFSKAISLVQTIKVDDSKTWALRDIAINLAKVGKLSDALKLVESFTFPPNFDLSWLLGEMAVALTEERDLSEVLKVVAKIPDTSQKNSVLNQIAYQLTEAEKLSEALSVVKLLESNSDGLQGIADKYADMGQFAQALQIAEMIQARDSKARALSNIAISYGEAGKFTDALQIAQKIEDGYFKDLALGSIAVYLAEAGRLSDSLQLMATLDEYSQKITLVDITVRLAESGQFPEALPIDEIVRDSDEKGALLATVAGKLARRGKLEDARKIAQTIEYKYFQSVALAEVAIYYDRNEKKELAKDILAQGLEIAETISTAKQKSEALSLIAAKYIETGAGELGKSIFARSLEIAQNISDPQEKESSLFLIISRLTEVGAVSEALGIANRFKDEVKQLAISQIAFKLIEIKDYSQALDLVSNPETEHLKREVMIQIGYNLLNSDDERKFDRLLELAGTLENDVFKEWGLANIAVELAIAGERNRGLEIVQTLSNQEMKGSALLKIAESYRKTGENERVPGILTEVLELVESTLRITEISEKSAAKAEIMGKIAVQFAAAGEMKKSQELLH